MRTENGLCCGFCCIAAAILVQARPQVICLRSACFSWGGSMQIVAIKPKLKESMADDQAVGNGPMHV
jgi:hypothetical protein